MRTGSVPSTFAGEGSALHRLEPWALLNFFGASRELQSEDRR
jgi:hypothetical protein